MRFLDPTLQAALEAWRGETGTASAEADIVSRAEADNIWFEERVSLERQQVFENAAAGASTADALRQRHTDYWKTRVTVTEDTPDTFVTALNPADLGSQVIDEYQTIVRLEALRRPLEKWSLSFKELENAHRRGDAPVLQHFLDVWNDSNIRDHRPAFAAWKDEVLSELAVPDWPDQLRDRLGLAHYTPASDGPIAVALMEYTVREVKAEAVRQGLPICLTAPTVLDSGPWPHFFPAPRDLPYGRAMSLDPVDDEKRLLAEMLHTRLTYLPRHIARIGHIMRPPAPRELKDLRNRHLLAVQVASGRADFGEEIP
jgi:hypothetical protein